MTQEPAGFVGHEEAAEQAAGQAGEEAADAEGDELGAHGGETEGGGGLLVVPHGQHRPAQTAATDAGHGHDGEGQDPEAHVVVGPLRRQRDPEPLLAGQQDQGRVVGEDRSGQQPRRGHGEGQGGDGEEQPGHAQRRGPHEHRHEGRDDPGRQQQGAREREAHLDHEGVGGHGPQAEEGHLAERELPGPAGEDGEGQGQEGEDQDAAVEEVTGGLGDDQGEEHGDEQGDARAQRRQVPDPPEALDGSGDRPRPVGRTTTTPGRPASVRPKPWIRTVTSTMTSRAASSRPGSPGG